MQRSMQSPASKMDKSMIQHGGLVTGVGLVTILHLLPLENPIK